MNASKAEIAKREEVLAVLRAEDLEEVEASVIMKYTSALSAMSAELRAMIPSMPPKSYWQEHYYPVMFGMFASGGATSSQMVVAKTKAKRKQQAKGPGKTKGQGKGAGRGGKK